MEEVQAANGFLQQESEAAMAAQFSDHHHGVDGPAQLLTMAEEHLREVQKQMAAMAQDHEDELHQLETLHELERTHAETARQAHLCELETENADLHRHIEELEGHISSTTPVPAAVISPSVAEAPGHGRWTEARRTARVSSDDMQAVQAYLLSGGVPATASSQRNQVYLYCQIQQLTADLGHTQKANEVLKADMKVLEGLSDRCRAEHSVTTINALRAEHKTIQRKMGSLQEELAAERKAHHQDLSARDARTRDQQHLLETLQTEHAEALAHATQEGFGHRQAAAQLKVEITKLRTENEGSKRQCAALQTTVDTLKVRLEEEHATVLSAVQRSVGEDRSQIDLLLAEHQRDLAHLQQQHALSLQERQAEWERQLASKEAELARRSQLMEVLQGKLAEQRTAHAQELSDTTVRLGQARDAAASEARHLRQDVDRLEQESVSAQAHLARLTEAHQAQEHELRDLQRISQEAEREHQAVLRRLKDDQRARTEQEQEMVRQQFKLLRDENHILRNDVAHFKDRFHAAQQAMAAQEHQLQTVRQNFDEDRAALNQRLEHERDRNRFEQGMAGHTPGRGLASFHRELVPGQHPGSATALSHLQELQHQNIEQQEEQLRLTQQQQHDTTLLDMEDHATALKVDYTRQIRELWREKTALLENLVQSNSNLRELSQLVEDLCGNGHGGSGTDEDLSELSPDELKQRLMRLQRENTALTAENARVRTVGQPLPKSGEDMEQHMANASGAVLRLTQQLETTEQERLHQRREVLQLRTQQDSLQRGLLEARQRMETLQEQVQQAYNEGRNMPHLKTALTAPLSFTAEEQLRTLVILLRGADAHQQDLRQQLDVLVEANDQLHRERTDVQAQTTALSTQLVQRSSLEASETANLHGVLGSVRSGFDSVAETLRHQVTDLGSELELSNDEVRRLRQRLSGKQSDLTQVTADLQLARDRCLAAERDQESERQRRQELERVAAELRTELAATNAHLAVGQTELNSQSLARVHLEARLVGMDAELSRTLQNLDQLRLAEQQARAALGDTEVAKAQLQREVKLAGDEAAGLRSAMKNLQETHEANSLVAQHLDSSVGESLKSQLLATRAAMDEEEELHERERLRAHEEMLALRAQLTREQRQAGVTVANLERRLQTLQTRLDRQVGTTQVAEAAAQQLRDDNHRLQQQEAVMRLAEEAHTRSLQQLQTAVRDKEREIVALRAAKQRLLDDLTRAQQQRQNMETRSRQLQTKALADMHRQMELNAQGLQTISLLRPVQALSSSGLLATNGTTPTRVS